ncbi:spore cortex biosynthesis protein YabQ [Sporolactobacillus sp. Y61]|jgi:spore cortex biosynthesis protein YabQ|uniref:Spore cortex biosynthesis protein YabQ n=1 Tax=Sporolactobacillus sp. Y61 TaxID=3160863 RepID=A0AAU8IH93_9BACL|nr:spore cortex biosynthesis protein YabQ [Sporolactobacillus sp. THM19-2]RYL89832.1 spore cortex biosynthesis protein YabQ [Sporolactobacillus sp. THM19-2]
MTLEDQFQSLGLMVLMGIWIGASFSVYHFFIRPEGKQRRILLLIADPLFWIMQALLLFSLLLPVNDGQLRLYLFLGILLGYSVYKALLEGPFMHGFIRLVAQIVQLWQFTAKTVRLLLLRPLFFLLKVVCKLCKMTLNTILRILLLLLNVPLKIIRGLLYLILPDKWLIRFRTEWVRFSRILMKGLAFLKGKVGK